MKKILSIILMMVMLVCSVSFQNVKPASAKEICYTVLGDYTINTRQLVTRGSLTYLTKSGGKEKKAKKRNWRITSKTKFYQYSAQKLLKKKKDKLVAIRSANMDKNKLEILVSNNELKEVVIWYYPPERYINSSDIPVGCIWHEALEKYSINTKRLVTSGPLICYDTNGVIKYKGAKKRTFNITSSTKIYKYTDDGGEVVKIKNKRNKTRAIRNANINKNKLEIVLSGHKIKHLVICKRSA